MEKFSVKNLLLAEVGERISYPLKMNLSRLDLPDAISAHSAEGKITFTKLEDSILAEGDILAKVTLICDRCLENFEQIINYKLNREYLLSRKEKSEEDLFVDKYGDIEISEAVREDLILATPMKNLCHQNCLGICPNCGENLNNKKCKCSNNSKNKSK